MAPEAGTVDSIGVVLVANGEVFLRSESGIRQIETGAEVYEGEELVTGHGSNAEIRFVDDTLLSQGADSVIALDDYIYDSEATDASTLLFKMSQGTFRMVTGKIAEQNPERFQLGTPLATIGIRGTTTVHEISSDGQEKHGVEEIHSGKALLVQSIDGQVRLIDSPQALVDIAASGLMSSVRPMTMQEFNTFREIAPEAIRQEQEIQQEQQQDRSDDQQDDTPVSAEQTGDEQPQNDEGDQQADQADGGDTGNMQIAGEGVLEPGVTEILTGTTIEGELGIQEVVNDVAMGYAELAFEAVAVGDLDTAQELLAKLEDLPTDEDIIELIEGVAQGTTTPPEGTEDVTVTTDDGINYILGTNGDDIWEGTANSDYYDGLGGDDTISGMESGDGLRGNTGNDTVYGNCGDDTIEGGDGNDFLFGGNGSDSIDGGDGTDILSFADLSTGVDAYIGGGTATATVDGTVETDTFTNIEGLMGSGYDDTLSGSDSDNTFYGSPGNDMISGLGGENTVSYEYVSASVSVDLENGTAVKTYSCECTETDILHDINHATGTTYGDTISGNASGNYLSGMSGADVISGLGGNDTLYGGSGRDTLYGGDGSDQYYYSTTGEGGDTVNFGSGDKFAFSSSSVYAGASLSVKDNYDGSSGSSSGEEFIYDSASDQLWYDPDGSGSEAGELIASITDSSVVLSDADIAFV